MQLRTVIFGAFCALIFAAPHVACTGDDPDLGPAPPDAGGAPETSADGADGGDGEVPLVPANKVDILFVIDNSASMGDKTALLASSVGPFLRDLARVGDLHVGVLASSLGSFGGDVCPNEGNFNTFAHLRPSPNAASGVLTYNGGDVEGLVKNTEDLVRGVGENGCGLEAQLETAYRFLVQPDPWKTVEVDATSSQARLEGVDDTVLAQRRAFLRPDSAVVVVLITDEDDSSADPLSFDGRGWAFMNRTFPGSKVFRGGDSRNGSTAARGTSACTAPGKGPAHPECVSCALALTCDAGDPACDAIKNDANCKFFGAPPPSSDATGYAGFYPATDDNLNVRFHRMKERFGVDPQYPIARYVDGLTNARVPNRNAEHPTSEVNGKTKIAEYTRATSCTNPLFAATLPGGSGEELCDLPRGPRNAGLVLFTVLGGVPNALVANAPNWNAALGSNPEGYDTTGVDPHMIQSVEPRGGLAPPTDVRGDNGSDPIHGREWNTAKDDLQYACTFTLPALRLCAAQEASCDCAIAERNPPLCSATLGEQTKGKAYPSVRPLMVARALGKRGVVGSICSSTGYADTISQLGSRLAPLLAQ